MSPVRDVWKGVDRDHALWRAFLSLDDRDIYLGHFPAAFDAARARDRAMICYRGWESAQHEGLNLIGENYVSEIEFLESVDFIRLLHLIRNDGIILEG